jgi:hypothetical protein
MPTFREMFKKLDKTGDGTITIQEFVKCPKSIREELCNLFNTDDLVELFELLDFDGSHSIQIEEFCDEMTKLSTTIESVEHIRLMRQMHMLRDAVKENHITTSSMMETVYALSQRRDGGERRNIASSSPTHEITLEKRMSGLENEVAKMAMTFEERFSDMTQTLRHILSEMQSGRTMVRQERGILV